MAKCFWCDVSLLSRDMPKRDGWYVEYRCPDCGNRYIFADEHTYIMPMGACAEGEIWAMEQSYKKGMVSKKGGGADSAGQAKDLKSKFTERYRID